MLNLYAIRSSTIQPYSIVAFATTTYSTWYSCAVVLHKVRVQVLPVVVERDATRYQLCFILLPVVPAQLLPMRAVPRKSQLTTHNPIVATFSSLLWNHSSLCCSRALGVLHYCTGVALYILLGVLPLGGRHSLLSQ